MDVHCVVHILATVLQETGKLYQRFGSAADYLFFFGPRDTILLVVV